MAADILWPVAADVLWPVAADVLWPVAADVPWPVAADVPWPVADCVSKCAHSGRCNLLKRRLFILSLLEQTS